MESKKLFLGFIGPVMDQIETVCKVAQGFECWNLKCLKFDGFIVAIKDRIPPVNDNVLRNYTRGVPAADSSSGIDEAEYEMSSWGLLLPDNLPGALVNGFAETLFLLNLYSPNFLFPSFLVTDHGISRPDQIRPHLFHFAQQNEGRIFTDEKFVRFHNQLISESIYCCWQRDRMARWSKEDWRLFVACRLFTGLKGFVGSKELFSCSANPLT